MVIIGNSAKLNCFKHSKNFQCKYQHYGEPKHEFAVENKKTALIIDNCLAHRESTRLKMITLIFLPPNTTPRPKPNP